MKKIYVSVLLSILFGNFSKSQTLSCPIDTCDIFSNYFINRGPTALTYQQAIDSGFYYTIDQNLIQGLDTTVCYAFVEPASGSWSNLQLFVNYPSCVKSTTYTGYGGMCSSTAINGWNVNLTCSTIGGNTCIKGTLTGNHDPGSPNEFSTMGTYEYPGCNQVDTKIAAGQCSNLTVGKTYKHCFKIIKSNSCPGNIIISPVITCNGCVPSGKTCKPIEWQGAVTNSTCPTNLNGAIDLTVCATRKFQYLWNDSNTTEDRTGLSPGTYQVTITDTESPGCDTTVSFVVTPEICKGVQLTSSSVCKGTCDTITPVIIGYNSPFTIKWSDGYSSTGPHVVCPATTTTYTVTVADGTTTSTAIATVTVEIPNVIASSDVSFCIGDSTILTATGATNYIWSPATGLSTTTGPTTLSKPGSVGTYIYTVIGTTALGCKDDDQVVVTVVSTTPTADLGSDRIICPSRGETPITLTATGGNIFTWSTGESTNSIVVSPTEKTIYTVTVGNTCSVTTAMDEIEVIVQCELEIPNVITPNGDPDNQYFEIDHMDMYPNSRLEIYDRWGLKMYESDNYQNEWDGGNYKTGKPVTNGVYYYILYLSDKDKTTYKGFITVLASEGYF